jgi:hypothetical protein
LPAAQRQNDLSDELFIYSAGAGIGVVTGAGGMGAGFSVAFLEGAFVGALLLETSLYPQSSPHVVPQPPEEHFLQKSRSFMSANTSRTGVQRGLQPVSQPTSQPTFSQGLTHATGRQGRHFTGPQALQAGSHTAQTPHSPSRHLFTPSTRSNNSMPKLVLLKTTLTSIAPKIILVFIV